MAQLYEHTDIKSFVDVKHVYNASIENYEKMDRKEKKNALTVHVENSVIFFGAFNQDMAKDREST